MPARPPLRIGITLGDPAGIGPEVALKAVHSLKSKHILPVLIGRAAVLLRSYGKLFRGVSVIDSPVAGKVKPGGIFLLDIPLDFPLPDPGQGTPDTGRESLRYIDESVELWKSGFLDAIVTGPVSKSLIEKSGTSFTGHTEHMAGLIGETTPYMMMFSRYYRVLLATTHIPLGEVPGSVSRERLLEVIRAGNLALASIDGRPPRMAVAGLDPHCGDEGAIGDFDERVTRPAVEQARSEGIEVEGPLAADTLFIPGRWREYGLAIAQYHDQGLIPFKMMAFDKGVNVTLGLSLTRTSVDHGTAFDIAGKNRAGFGSMVSAMRLAYLLECRRRISRGR